tara:strand:+ start:593 stop:748 length:156 start_codon:yes stop_codon:yes gene_type:complete
MGRKKKYHTEEEKKAARAAHFKTWYEKNKVSLNEKRMKDYYELRKDTQSDN